MLYPGNWNMKDKDKIIDYIGNVMSENAYKINYTN